MKQEIIIAGFGGQGVLSMGKIWLIRPDGRKGSQLDAFLRPRTTGRHSQRNRHPEQTTRHQLSRIERI